MVNLHTSNLLQSFNGCGVSIKMVKILVHTVRHEIIIESIAPINHPQYITFDQVSQLP